MKKRVLRMLPLIFVCSIAAVVLADKKTAAIAIKLVRMEGKADEIVIYPADFTIEKPVSWTKSSDSTSNGDDPVLEFTSADPASLSCELFFDTFETQENVYKKNVQPLENLAAVDASLQRPPMVSVTFQPFNAAPPFRGVVSSVSTKYTMFLPDGTPVRATTNLKLKAASKASFKKSQ